MTSIGSEHHEGTGILWEPPEGWKHPHSAGRSGPRWQTLVASEILDIAAMNIALQSMQRLFRHWQVHAE